jgi:hypothetical protein
LRLNCTPSRAQASRGFYRVVGGDADQYSSTQ